MSLNGHALEHPAACGVTPTEGISLPAGGALPESEAWAPLGAAAVGIRRDPLSGDRYWIFLRGEDGGYPLVHRDSFPDAVQAEERKTFLQAFLQSLGIKIAAERHRDLRHGQQLVELRVLALALGEQLGMSRELIDLDMSRAVPYVLEGADAGDPVGIFFFPKVQRLVALRGDLVEGPRKNLTPQFDPSEVREVLATGARPEGFILLKVASTDRVRFHVMEVCAPSGVADARARALALLGNPA